MEFKGSVKGGAFGSAAPIAPAIGARGMKLESTPSSIKGATVPTPSSIKGATVPTPGPPLGKIPSPCGCSTPIRKAGDACGCSPPPGAPVPQSAVNTRFATTTANAVLPSKGLALVSQPIHTAVVGAELPVASSPPPRSVAFGSPIKGGSFAVGTPTTKDPSTCGRSQRLGAPVQQNTARREGMFASGAIARNDENVPPEGDQTVRSWAPDHVSIATHTPPIKTPFGTPIGLTRVPTIEINKEAFPSGSPITRPLSRPKLLRRVPRTMTPGQNVWANHGPDGNPSNELSLTTIQMSAGQPILLASYNGLRECGWTRSTNGGKRWTSNTEPLPPIKMAYQFGSRLPIMSSICLADTWATALGSERPNFVAITAVVAVTGLIQVNGSFIDFTGGPTYADVGLWVSKDGGATFPKNGSIRVSEAGSSFVDRLLFNGSFVDGPKIAAEPSGDAVWIWWWGADKSWLRKFTIDGNGFPMAATDPIELNVHPGLDPNRIRHASLTIAPMGAGKPSRIFLTYPDAGMAHPDGLNCNSSNPALWFRGPVRWHMTYSDDEGKTWNPPKLITEDPDWPFCISQGTRGGNRSYASTSYDRVSKHLLITLNKTVLRVDGKYVGTRAMLFQWPSSNPKIDEQGFDSWVPVCNLAACPDSERPCMTSWLLPINEEFCHQYGPSVNRIDIPFGSSRAAWIWYDTRDSMLPHPPIIARVPGQPDVPISLETDIWGATMRPGVPYDFQPRTQRRITPRAIGSAPVPWNPNAATFGNSWWGDYSNGVTPLGDGFYGMWADMRDSTTKARLYGASVAP